MRHGILTLLVPLLAFALAAPAAAQSYLDVLRRPKVLNGDLTFPNIEAIQNDTDDIVCWEGQGGTNNTDACWDLDGTHPVLYSHTDASVEINDALIIGGAITLANDETISNATDDMIDFGGAGGADDTDLRLDLDGAQPTLSSVTDTAIGIDDDLTFIGAQQIDTSAGALTIAPTTILALAPTTDLDVTGANHDFDPTGAFTLDMDAAQAVAVTLADMDAGFVLQAAGGEDMLLVNYSAGTKSLAFGNAADNPTYESLGTGDWTYGGGLLIEGAASGLDTSAAGLLNIGVATATSIIVGSAGTTIDLQTSDWTLGTTGDMAGIGAITSDGAATLDTGAAGSSFGGALTVTGALDAASSAIGGGYGATGCSTSGAGVLQCNGAATADGGVLVGAGQGITVSAAGALNLGVATATSINVGHAGTTLAVVTSDWGISATGDLANLGTVQADGDVDLTAAGGATGTADLDVAGYAQFAGVVEVDGLLDADAGLDVSGGTAVFTGTNVDFDPTGDFYVDLDASQDARFVVSDNYASAFVVREGAMVEYIKVDTTDNSEIVTFGNGMTNPNVRIAGAGGFQLPVNETLVPAEPVACGATTVGFVQYVDDDNDGAIAEVCICVATADDGVGNPNAWDWVQMANLAVACSFF